MYRVGILVGLDFMSGVADGFKEKMTSLGYVEGENITYDVYTSNFDMNEYRKCLNKFVEDKVDLIMTFPTEASIEAKEATKGTDIPVIFTVAFVEETGLINSVREPGGNITGVRYPGPDLVVKRFEIIRELVPQAKRLFIPFQKGYPSINSQMEVLRPVAAAEGVTLLEAPAANAAELDTLVRSYQQGADPGFDAILFLAEPLAVTPDAFAVMARFAAEHKIPIGGALMKAEGYGAVFGVNIDPVATGGQASVLADKIFKGNRAGTIPVISSENYIEIDYAEAQNLGIAVSENLLVQADRVVR